MSSALGIDLYCADDMRLDMPTVSGRMNLGLALLRRLTTPNGRFSWLDLDGVTVRGWPEYGLDLRGFILSKTNADTIARAAEGECAKDERVHAVTATAVYTAANAIALTLEITDEDGPFVLTLSISDAAATLVSLQEAA